MLTRKQLELLKFISKRLEKDGVSPSFDEMKEALNLRSKSGIHRAEAGFKPSVIEGGNNGLPASTNPMPSRMDAVELQVMGRIAAGTPISAIEHASHNVAVPGTMLAGSGHHFALEVKGDSMIDAGIHNGDVVVIREQPDANNGDIIVALVEEEEATLKRLRRRGSAIALEAANPAYETRVYRDDQVRIQGRMVGLIRTEQRGAYRNRYSDRAPPVL